MRALRGARAPATRQVPAAPRHSEIKSDASDEPARSCSVNGCQRGPGEPAGQRPWSGRLRWCVFGKGARLPRGRPQATSTHPISALIELATGLNGVNHMDKKASPNPSSLSIGNAGYIASGT